jgi:hypothetical protein
VHRHELWQLLNVALLLPLQFPRQALASQLTTVPALQALPPLHSKSHVPLPQLMTVPVHAPFAVQLTSQP